jgi:nitroreductase
LIYDFRRLELAVSKIYRAHENEHKIGGRKYVFSKMPECVQISVKMLLQLLSMLINFTYDFKRVLKHSTGVFYANDRDKLEALITISYHGIEKGMSLRNQRVNFGIKNIEILLERIEFHRRIYGKSRIMKITLSVLNEYFNRSDYNRIPVDIVRKYECLRSDLVDDLNDGGVEEVSMNEIRKHCVIDLEKFFWNRYSIRQFSDEEIDDDILFKAIRLAQKSPSVCNRQPGRVHIIKNQDKILEAMTIQSGGKGFEDQIKRLIVVTSDLKCFQSVGERNQCWIDGGLFAMSLIYAMHSMGLGTCCLNWSKGWKDDRRIRKVVDIPQHENIIMFIAVGVIPATLKVAKSKRKEVNEITKIY